MVDIYIVVIMCFVISSIVVGASRVFVARVLKFDKMEGYECGFQPFKAEIGEFDVQFYIVALLFLIFDVELMLLFPWSVIEITMASWSYGIFVAFMFVLFVGVWYEWKSGGIEFDS